MHKKQGIHEIWNPVTLVNIHLFSLATLPLVRSAGLVIIAFDGLKKLRRYPITLELIIKSVTAKIGVGSFIILLLGEPKS
jgi:hypothetical protein